MELKESTHEESTEPKIPGFPELTGEEEKIKAFRLMLEEYAEEHGLEITSIKGWTEHKIQWMALNNNKCCCSPDDRICPCEEGLREAMTEQDHMCLCSIFKR